MEHKELYIIALGKIHNHKCANCLEHNLKIKKFTPQSKYQAEVIYACPQCNEIEFKESVFDEGYLMD